METVVRDAHSILDADGSKKNVRAQYPIANIPLL